MGRISQVYNPFYTTSDATYGVTQYFYDALGRKIQTTNPDGTTTQSCYDGLATNAQTNCNNYLGQSYVGPWVDSSDENGNDWQQASNALGQLKVVVEPNGASTTPSMETDYGYNALNDLLSVTQWGGASGSSGARTRSFTYDGLSRLVQAFNPETGWVCYGTTPSSAAPSGSNCTEGYDANGNLTAKTDGRGDSVTYTYDALNRKTSEVSTTLPTFTHSFYYDQASVAGITFSNPIGRLTAATTWFNGSPLLTAETSLYWNHDAMGRVLGTKTCIETTCNNTNIADSTWYSLNDTYDLVGNLTSYTDGFGTTVSARYDAAGRLSNVSTAGNGTTPTGTLWTANTYGAVGLTQATYGSSQAVENLQYTKRMALQSSSTVNASNATLYSEGITYYPNLNMKTATDLVNGKWSYTYDTLNRLSTAAVTSGTANAGESCQFGYDAFGNRTSEAAPQGSSCFNATPFTFTKTATNRVDGYCYDGAGNLLDTQACPAAGSHDQYYYDGFGNMLSPNYNSAGATSYTVDALGQRIAKWSGGTMTNQYLYGADGQAVAEMDGSGNWLRTNVRVGGQFLAELQGTKTYYRLNDHLGTVRAEFGSDGCLSTYTSLPFGDGQTTVANGCADITLHHFTGKERDTESGNDYFGARYYASSMGRWMSPDPSMESEILEIPQTWNRYSYVYNRPLYGTDPDGRCPPCVGALIGGAVGGLAEGGWNLGSQLISNGGNLGQVSWSQVGANAAGGAVAGAITGATGGLGLIGDALVGAGANVVGGAVTRTAEGEDTSASDVAEDALAGYAGGTLGHVAADLVHIPSEPKVPNNLKSYLKMKKYNAKMFQRNVAKGIQTGIGTATGTPPAHTVSGAFWLLDLFGNPPPPPPPPPPPTPPGGGTGTIVGCQTMDGQPCG